ncbi:MULTISPECIES: four helix bundle protein [Flavobacteriales]|uniref:Four helix bundle protein n=1 Tax=Bergeyella zoohelcum TaxID=1015 RepID=A0A7Z8YRY3_9FLAO|nr:MULTISPECIES: four helix bundle protein [Flavobacteriales]ATA72667.1 four helix bundle protein [Capnocytophaga sp. H4358]VDH05080.1 four helix bundle protein [Bergeyella zoohelcum]
MKDNDLLQRFFDFAVRVIKLSRDLSNTTEMKVVKNQLIRAVTSIGANYEEAQAGSSKSDFVNKVNFSLKEARETNYWLRLIKEVENTNLEIEEIIQESKEIKNILGAIVKKARG